MMVITKGCFDRVLTNDADPLSLARVMRQWHSCQAYLNWQTRYILVISSQL